MLQIRLSKPTAEIGGSAKSVPIDTVTVTCPDHLVLADLPVAKGLGSASANAVVKSVGRRSSRQIGQRVHFCVQCDFPIAVYGRLSPCEHAFCFDCARSDSFCYLCDERIQKIQTIKMLEGLFVCAAPHCFKSFLRKDDFASHLRQAHADLIYPERENGVNESDATSAGKYAASDSTVQAPPRPLFSPNSNPQLQTQQSFTRPVINSLPPVSPFPGQILNRPPELQQPENNNQSQVLDRSGSLNRFPQQAFDPRGQAPPQFGYAPYTYEISRQDSTTQDKSPGFQVGPMNFAQNYARPPMASSQGFMNMGAVGTVPLEPPMVSSQGFMSMDQQGRGVFFQGNYGQQNMMMQLPSNVSTPSKGDGSQVSPLPPPPPPPIPPPPHVLQLRRDRSYSGDENINDAPPGFGWQT